MIQDFRPLYPSVLLTILGIAVILIDAFVPRRKPGLLGWLTAGVVLAALGLDWIAPNAKPWNGLVAFDSFSRGFDTIFLLSLALVAAASAAVENRMKFVGEYYGLLIFSTIGLMLMASAGGLLMLYVGIELSTISLFALVGLAKRERRSAEASVKLFVLGAVASAVILYGASILYGVTVSQLGSAGNTNYDIMARALTGVGGVPGAALWLGFAMVVGGILFKVAAAPFHLWAPDVYQGAPSTVTAYLSTASKAGAFAALLRFLWVAMGAQAEQWIPLIAALAVFSMILGNFIALAQTNLKRLLAYSGIAQAGYIMVALSAGPQSELAVGSICMYLLLYAFTNVGGFLIVEAVQAATGSDDITALRGLHRRSPLLALGMLVVLFSLGGIPPLAGFVGKLYLFAAGWEGGQYALVLIGAIVSVIALYYYLMVALQVYIKDPADDRRLPVARPLIASIAVCILGTLAIGVYPRPWVELGNTAKHGLTVDSVTALKPPPAQSAD